MPSRLNLIARELIDARVGESLELAFPVTEMGLVSLPHRLFTTNSPSAIRPMNTISFVLQALEVAVLVITFLAVVFGLYTTRKHFGVMRSMAYIERFNSEAGIKLRTRIDAWLAEPDDRVKLEQFLSNPELKNQVLAFMNLFQELGVAYRNRLLDTGVLLDMFDYLVPHYWSKLDFLVAYYRAKTGDETLYRRFGNLNDEILRLRNKAEG